MIPPAALPSPQLDGGGPGAGQSLAGSTAWAEAALAARLFAVDPAGLGGVWLRARPGSVRERWLALLRAALPDGAPLRRLPLGAPDSRLLGGLDLAATLRAGRPVVERGVLAACDGGAVMLAMAERLAPSVAGRIAAVLDAGEVALERDGLTERLPARLGAVALDEGVDDEPLPPAALTERLGFWLDLEGIGIADAVGGGDLHRQPSPPLSCSPRGLGPPGSAEGRLEDRLRPTRGQALAEHPRLRQTQPVRTEDVDATPARGMTEAWIGEAAAEVGSARERLPTVRVEDEVVSALCAAAAAFGIQSMRPPLLALRTARAAAALAGRNTATGEDAALAARLVLGPRATRLPAAAAPAPDEAAAAQQGAPDVPPPPAEDAREQVPPQSTGQALEEIILAAARSAVPPHLLSSLASPSATASRSAQAAVGRSGQARGGGKRGVPVGTMPGRLRPGARVSLVETLRAAAPWQRLRRRQAGGGAAHAAAAAASSRRPMLRPEDVRLVRFRERTATTAVFVVDASGSAALHRLAEVKGAVELLLADCYARRDRVALLAFRGAGATLLLPPTTSLVRAKRCLASLPGGGGTPVAAGLDAAAALARAERRAGRTPLLVVLTDGQANVARDGAADRARAAADAQDAARRLRGTGPALLVDTAPRPRPQAERLAAEMAARYLPLPLAGNAAAALSRTVRAAATAAAAAAG